MARDEFRCPSCKKVFLKSRDYYNEGLMCTACKCPIEKTNVKTELTPLLTIELQDETSVPKVFYKGQEIQMKTNITFDWESDTEYIGGLSYAIEHYVQENVYPTLNRIERRVKGHATN